MPASARYENLPRGAPSASRKSAISAACRSAPGSASRLRYSGMQGESGKGAVGGAVGARVVDGKELDQVQARVAAPRARAATRSANSPTPQPALVRRAATGIEMPVKWRSSGAKRIGSTSRVEDARRAVKCGRPRGGQPSSGIGLQRFTSHSATRPQLKQMKRGARARSLISWNLPGAGQYAEMSLVLALACLLCS